MSKQIQIETPVTLNWEGITFNGEVYKQYSPTNVELNIKHILELNKQKKLRYFFLLPERREYLDLVNLGVDFKTGLFHINGMKFDPRPDILKSIIPQYRLIFFRRNRKAMGEGMNFYSSWIHRYLLGWQVSYEEKNYQRIMFIDPETLTIEIKEKR